VTATSRGRASVGRKLVTTFLPVVAVSAAVAGCSSSPSAADKPDEHTAKVPALHLLAAKRAPAGWKFAAQPDGTAVLAIPPDMHQVEGDPGTVSAARIAGGKFVMYLNSTPKQNKETLSNWPEFRIEHLKDESASTARLLAASHGVRFLGGTGSCVLDTYVTKIKSNHYTELACIVQDKSGSNVIIAAALSASWKSDSSTLMRAVAAYQVK